ncbi:MAG: metallophosphoesterase [Verrucomicrobia bacterium]|nr:metallophosphoesterase [Verrucomicrobiota bacterium]
MTRRQWLRASAGALLTLGAWPGRLRAAENGRGGTFRFVAVNDAHFQSPRCPAWFERVSASIRAHDPRPEFCLMIGDLAQHGVRTELGAMREVLRSLRMPAYSVIGNHDYVSNTDRSSWDELFPRSLNYHFEHRGWRFIGLDSSEGIKWENTRVQAATFRWLDAELPKLDRATPTVVFTHFPLGVLVPSRPLNADDVLDRFKEFNLVAVFSGHFHGYTERKSGRATLTTNRCCSISRANHDGSPEKGYFLCTARDGQIHREFIEVKPE